MKKCFITGVEMVALVAALLAVLCAAASAANLLSDPSFDTWAGWTRAGNYPGSSNIWYSTWIGWTDGHTGTGYNIACKHGGYDPKDDTTSVDIWMYQNVLNVAPGAYEASLWFKTGGTGPKWDGTGGADQWTDFRIYYWADNACTQMVYASTAPRIEVVTPQWTKKTISITVPATGVKALSFYMYARMVDRWDGAWVGWDDAYLGPVGTTTYERISDLRDLPDGAFVSIPAKPISRNFSDHFYLEESDRSAGIKVVGTTTAVPDQAVSLQGVISTVSGERQITAGFIGAPIAAQQVRPLGTDASVLVKPGLSTLGLLLKTWGEVSVRPEGTVPPWFAVRSGSGSEVVVQNYSGLSVEPGDFIGFNAIHGRTSGVSGDTPILKLAATSDLSNTSATPIQLLTSGDFECSWSQFTSAFAIEGPTSNVSLDSSTKWRGSKSIKIVNNSVASNTFVNQSIPMDCSAGKRRVRISMMCKADNVVRGVYPWYGIRGIVWLCDATGQPVTTSQGSYELTEFPTRSFDWHCYERTLILPTSVRSIKLQLGLNGATGTAWFDDVGMIEAVNDHLVHESGDAQISINPAAVVSHTGEGVGWAWETVSPDRFNGLELMLWPELFNNMAWDGPDWLRVGVQPSMCPPAGYVRGTDTGQQYTYNFNTLQINKICDLLSYCQSHGIPVMLSNWDSGTGIYTGLPNGQWLVKGYYDGTGSAAADWWVPYSKDRMAEYLTELLYYLRVTKGFSCIRYIEIWNEPNGGWTQIGQYPQGFLDIANKLSTKMTTRGIRDQIKILGLGAVEAGDGAQISVDAVKQYGSVLDVMAVHDYSYSLEVPTDKTSSGYLDEWVNDYKGIISQLGNINGRRVPLLIGETNGMGTYVVYGAREQYITSLACAEYVIEMLKTGVEGILRWQYNQPGPSQYSPFSSIDFHAVPNKQIYYPYCVVTRWTVPGSDVLSTQVSGGFDARNKKRVRAAALRAPDGQITVLITNNGRLPKTVTIQFGTPVAGTWRHYYYNSSLPSGLQEGALPAVNGNTLTVTLSPESVNAVTTFATGLTGEAPR